MGTLRTAVVIDYQNLHLTGANLFEPHKRYHECLVHPLHYANQLVNARNVRQKPGYASAVLTKLLVYRGLPSSVHDPDDYARNLAQKAEWERDERVAVTLRPLKYRYQYTAEGRKASDINGVPIVVGKDEKGVDVLCALALVREARDPELDLVILASQDTDLEPALDEGFNLRRAKIETASWFNPKVRGSREIRGQAAIWNTRLNAQAFAAAQDLKTYV